MRMLQVLALMFALLASGYASHGDAGLALFEIIVGVFVLLADHVMYERSR